MDYKGLIVQNVEDGNFGCVENVTFSPSIMVRNFDPVSLELIGDVMEYKKDSIVVCDGINSPEQVNAFEKAINPPRYEVHTIDFYELSEEIEKNVKLLKQSNTVEYHKYKLSQEQDNETFLLEIVSLLVNIGNTLNQK